MDHRCSISLLKDITHDNQIEHVYSTIDYILLFKVFSQRTIIIDVCNTTDIEYYGKCTLIKLESNIMIINVVVCRGY